MSVDNTLPIEVVDFLPEILNNTNPNILMIQRKVEINIKDLVKFIKIKFIQSVEYNVFVKFLKVRNNNR